MASKKNNPVFDPTDNLKVTMPNQLSSELSGIFSGKPINPLITSPGEQDRLCWYDLESLKDSILKLFDITATQFQETTVMIQSVGGVDRLDEYNRVVATACNDLDRYSKDLVIIMNEHAGKTGFIETAEEHAVYMAIFEKYNSFSSYFQSALHHVMIAMTDFALEADAKRQRMNNENGAEHV